MNPQRQAILRDLAEEAKKRLVVVSICVVGVSYLMSLTSSSVLINIPAAALLIIIFRYFTLDYEIRRKALSYCSTTTTTGSTTTTTATISQTKSGDVVSNDSDSTDWRNKINSPVVEEAVDQFSRRLVAEWVTDLWYKKLTPDLQGPEELVHIINGVIGEISGRFRNINLIDLLTRDLIGIICNHLERFRTIQLKVDKQLSDSCIENRDENIRLILATEDKLHPALFSAESQHKVLQHLMENLIPLVCRPKDLQCSLFSYVCRELLASTIMRPVLNMANPRFINERIEVFVLSRKRKGALSPEDSPHSNSSEGSSKLQSDDFSKFSDPSGTGVELMQLKNSHPKSGALSPNTEVSNGDVSSKDPLLSMNTRSSHSWNSIPLNSQISTQGVVQRHQSAGEWGEILDIISQRKTAALAPENFDTMWTKGRSYEHPKLSESSKESTVSSSSAKSFVKKSNSEETMTLAKKSHASIPMGAKDEVSNQKTVSDEFVRAPLTELVDDSVSSSSVSSEEDDPGNVTGIDSPGTKVWDRKSNRNVAVTTRIHHPLETPVSRHRKKIGNGSSHYKQTARTRSLRKRSKSTSLNSNAWQEVERISFLSGDGQDILRSQGGANGTDSSSGSDVDIRICSGATATSSTPSDQVKSAVTSSMTVDSFFKLKSEVLGANIVRSGSKTFAVYSISVIDVNNNSWSIKRRFRHFEELHRRLKEYPEYDLHLPPKHFLSAGLDVYVIQERCQLLDRYLKKVMKLPKIAASIELWDFLSVDSQTYYFSSSFSIVETLPVNLEENVTERNEKGSITISSRREIIHKGNISESDVHTAGKMKPGDHRNTSENSVSDSETQKTARTDRIFERSARTHNPEELLSDPAGGAPFPVEWVPPNVTLPILDLVDVIFQFQDGGWIRRKAFWVVKQVLQLGMGDALDDWVLEKIQLLRKGSVIASIVRRVESLLWPDGIFISKHPKRRAQSGTDASSPRNANASDAALTEEQRVEASRRAKFVQELMIDNAPAAVVGLVGRKEYEQSAKDLFQFIQSSVCVKLLALDLVELVVLSAFPEMEAPFRQLHNQKHIFGQFVPSPPLS